MKIGLVNPPFEYNSDPSNQDFICLPGISYISTILRDRGYDIKTIDFEYDRQTKISDLDDCDIVGLTSLLNCYKFFSNVLPVLSEKGKTIIVGGPMISSYGEKNNLLMRIFPQIDFGIIGEGEIAIIDLMDKLRREKTHSRRIIRTETINDLDDLPEMRYNDWGGLEKKVRGHTFCLQLSRGCSNPTPCSFCYRLSQRVRSFSLERIEREIAKIAEMKPRQLLFCDDNFLYNHERAIAIGKIVQRCGLPYRIEARVTDVTQDLLRELKETGCNQIKFGVETFDDELLKRSLKRVTAKQAKYAIKITREIGIEAIGFILVGLPGENKKSIETTIHCIEETKLLPRARLLVPLPGTKIYYEALRQGKINEKQLLIDFSKSGNSDTVEGGWVPVNMSDGLTDGELIKARDKINALRKEIENEK